MTTKLDIDQFVKEVVRPFKKRADQLSRIIVPSIGYLYADIAFFEKESRYNHGYKYALVVIDTFSRKAFVVPLKNKTTLLISEEMYNIIEEIEKDHDVIQITSDNGGEFNSLEFEKMLELFEKKFNKNNKPSSGVEPADKKIQQGRDKITQKFVEVGDHFSLGIIDRFIRTLRGDILKYWLKNDDLNWVDHINKIVDEYNNRINTGIDAKPNDVFSGKIKPKNKINTVDKLSVGNRVRVLLKKDVFDKKSQLQTWSSEVYEIKEIDGNKYKLVDKDGEMLKPRFARWQLQKTEFPLGVNSKLKKVMNELKQERNQERFLNREGIEQKNIIESRLRKRNF